MSRPHIYQIDLESLDLVEQEQLFLKAKRAIKGADFSGSASLS